MIIRMAGLNLEVLLILCVCSLIYSTEASAPFFLQAITSALGTIPFTAGPMTTGLVGAKLAVGSKLLYYLGFFGRRRSKPKPSPISASPKTNMGLNGPRFPVGMQSVPLPYGFGGEGLEQLGYGQYNFFPQYPYGYDPARLFQILAAQGGIPSTMQGFNFLESSTGQAIPSSQFPLSAAQGFPPSMQSFNFEGASGNQANPSSQFPFSTGAATQGSSVIGGGHGSPAATGSENSEAESDVESFFTFLRDMDDNTCISRLMCDIGANPSFLGEFSENINNIVGSLDVQPSSGAFQYITIMETGRRDGGCGPRFSQCSDAAYEVVKNVAPSVGMPHNINSETVNQF